MSDQALSAELSQTDQKQPKRQRGGQPSNRNSVSHGTRGYLASGSLPKGASYVRRLAGEFRTVLEATVVAKRGELDLYASALCQSAMRHEVRALLLQRWLRKEGGDLPVGERVKLLHEIGVSSDRRDACLKALGLDQADKPLDLAALKRATFAALDAKALETTKHTTPHQATPGATLGAQDGDSGGTL